MSTVAVNKIEDLSSNQNKGVLQVVSAVKDDVFSTTSTTSVDITDMAVTLTPRSTDSKVLILANCQLCVGLYGGYGCYVELFRKIGSGSATHIALNTDATDSDLRTTFSQINLQNYEHGMNGVIFLDSPSTTSSVEYKLSGFSNGGTFYLNRRGDGTAEGSISTITAMEIQGAI